MAEKTVWVGFSDGKPHVYDSPGDGKVVAVYARKKDAEFAYQDVRKGKLIVTESREDSGACSK